MKDLLKEFALSLQEASKDTAWAQKLCSAETWDGYEKLLDEKGIKAPSELKEVFDASRAGKVERLSDDNLDDVSGGSGALLPCKKVYDFVWCEMTFCPHFKKGEKYYDQREKRCDLGFWRQDLILPTLDDLYTQPTTEDEELKRLTDMIRQG